MRLSFDAIYRIPDSSREVRKLGNPITSSPGRSRDSGETAVAFKLMTSRTAFVFALLGFFALASVSPAGSADLVGSWKIEIRFSDGGSRSLRFDARDGGQGAFVPVIPRPNQTDSTEPAAAADWSEDGKGTLTFSGPIQFPLGNIGLERGTLVLNGRRGANGSITGTARLFPAEQGSGQPKPSRTGTFKASKIAG